MAAGDIVQKGTTVIVGFNGVTFGTWVMDEGTEEPQADVEDIRGAKNETLTLIISNPRKEYTVNGIILSADLTTARAAVIGGTVSVNSVSSRILSLKLTFGRLAAKCSMTVVKEDSMTYS